MRLKASGVPVAKWRRSGALTMVATAKDMDNNAIRGRMHLACSLSSRSTSGEAFALRFCRSIVFACYLLALSTSLMLEDRALDAHELGTARNW